MEQIIIDGLPNLSSNHPWLVANNLEENGDQFFCEINQSMTSYYRCRIPQLVGRRIRGCFHGWMILTDHPYDYYWSLWNPLTSKFIRLPRLKLKDGYFNDFNHCCLTSPPDVPGSILLLTRCSRPDFVFCRLDCKRKKIRWREMSYSKQLITTTGEDGLINFPTLCNGKIYAWAHLFSHSEPPLHVDIMPNRLLQVDIMSNEKEDVINLMPLVVFPDSLGFNKHILLKGSSEEIFVIAVSVTDTEPYEPYDVFLYKLDMSSKEWIEIKDFKDNVFFVDLTEDLANSNGVDRSLTIPSKFGGYIHMFHENGKVIYSYDMKDKTISMSSVDSPDFPPRSETSNISNISIWSMPEFRLQGDDDKCKDDPSKDEGMVVTSATNGSPLLDIPFDVLEMIMEFSIGIEYLRFHATCKRCRLAAPVIPSNNNRRLQTDSWVSPWLLVLDKNQSIVSFTNPMDGDKNQFMKTHQEVFNYDKILCSRYGWVLLYTDEDCMAFFNPFTNDIHKLPPLEEELDSLCFSAPPTSPDCMVVGFSSYEDSFWVYIHFVSGKPSWEMHHIDFHNTETPSSFRFPTLCGRDIYALFQEGGLRVFKEISSHNLTSKIVVDEDATLTSCSGEYFQVKCDQHHLLVIVGEFGESVEVFKLNEITKKWEKIDSIGEHMIFIDDTTCVCMDAKTPEMVNKIYFPRFHRDNGRIVFYSLETCKYHTFNGRNVEQNMSSFFGTKKTTYVHAWIEPTCF